MKAVFKFNCVKNVYRLTFKVLNYEITSFYLLFEIFVYSLGGPEVFVRYKSTAHHSRCTQERFENINHETI